MFGIKISNPGQDVKSCSDDNLVLSSEISTLKTLTSQELGPLDSYSHNLGYVPIFIYANYTDYKPLLLEFIGQHDTVNGYDAPIEATTTDIDNTDNSGLSSPVLVYVFYDEL